MTGWTVAAVALLPPFLLALIGAGRGAASGRLVAIQLVSTIGVFLLLALTFVDDQSSSIDLALSVAFLTLPATLLFAVFEERWL